MAIDGYASLTPGTKNIRFREGWRSFIHAHLQRGWLESGVFTGSPGSLVALGCGHPTMGAAGRKYETGVVFSMFVTRVLDQRALFSGSLSMASRLLHEKHFSAAALSGNHW
jgi:hypothetical protein